jgi:Transglycosylase SLT domain
VAAVALLCLLGVATVVVLVTREQRLGPTDRQPLGGVVDGVRPASTFTYDPARQADYEARAARGLSHVLYAKSPGGAFASAQRTARYRALVDGAARRHHVDPDTLEAIVLLESAGRADATASRDLHGAAGLTQILAETATSLLGMRVDLAASERLTRGIARGHRVAAREAKRRRVDERFDPAKALDATGRYLDFARRRLGREDLAVVAYHMGVGNLQHALAAYGAGAIPYAQLYFDSSPVRHAAAWRRLASLGDDSSTYLWRVMAAREIMRLYRGDPATLRRAATLQTHKASAEEVLHPEVSTQVFDSPRDVADARRSGKLRVLAPAELRDLGLSIDAGMGALAAKVGQSRLLYRALRPHALAVLEAIGAATKGISGTSPLVVTSTVRDRRYQKVLAATDLEATHAYSLHTTGWAFDVARSYRTRAQAQAFQFVLDRLTALDVIAWVREPAAIHVTVASG